VFVITHAAESDLIDGAAIAGSGAIRDLIKARAATLSF